jgi:hypothetical protein
MRNREVSDFCGVRAWLVRVSIAIVMSCLLFTLMSLPIFAHTQNKQDTRSQTIALAPHAPSGNADLRWDAHKQELTVVLNVNGLPPNSNHAAHIHAGNCSSMGRIIYSLHNVVTNKDGHAVVTTMIKGVKGGIPEKGWLIGIHKGSTASTPTILCGNVANPHKAMSVKVPLTVPPVKH